MHCQIAVPMAPQAPAKVINTKIGLHCQNWYALSVMLSFSVLQ